MRLPDIASVIGHRGAREPTGTDPGVCQRQLLRCGISIQPMTAMGQSRHKSSGRAVSLCPLYPKSWHPVLRADAW